MVTASIHSIPASCDRGGTTVACSLHDALPICSCTASIRGSWRGEAWCSCTLNSCIGTCCSYRWRCCVDNSDHLANRSEERRVGNDSISGSWERGGTTVD